MTASCERCDRTDVHSRGLCSRCYQAAYKDGEFGNYRRPPAERYQSPGVTQARVDELVAMRNAGTLFAEVEGIIDRALGVTAAEAKALLEEYEHRALRRRLVDRRLRAA